MPFACKHCEDALQQVYLMTHQAVLCLWLRVSLTVVLDAFSLPGMPTFVMAISTIPQQYHCTTDAAWNPELLQHVGTAQQRCQSTNNYSSSNNMLSPAKRGFVLFRGVRVRMGVATATVDVRKVHNITRRVEFGGHVMKKVQAVADLPDGGQVRDPRVVGCGGVVVGWDGSVRHARRGCAFKRELV